MKGVLGLSLDPDEIAIFRHHTGRSRYAPPAGGYQTAVAVVGRQSGKTQIAAALAAWEAVTAPRAPGSTGQYGLMIAQDFRGALRALFTYASGVFDSVPLLRGTVVGRTADTLTLRSGIVLAAYPCRPPAIRGLRARIAVLDELGFYRNAEGNPQDVEMLRAVRPTLATTGGRLVILSSPAGQSGALWDFYRGTSRGTRRRSSGSWASLDAAWPNRIGGPTRRILHPPGLSSAGRAGSGHARRVGDCLPRRRVLPRRARARPRGAATDGDRRDAARGEAGDEAGPRLPPDGGPEPGAGGRPPIGGDDAHRAQDRERVPALRDRGRGRPGGGREEARGAPHPGVCRRALRGGALPDEK
jgi:hypothetical protein